MNQIIDRIFKTNPIYRRIKKQIEKGINKYGTPVNPAHYSVLGWYRHQQQELADAQVYGEIQLYKVEQVTRKLEEAYTYRDIDNMRKQIKAALAILQDGNDNDG